MLCAVCCVLCSIRLELDQLVNRGMSFAGSQSLAVWRNLNARGFNVSYADVVQVWESVRCLMCDKCVTR
jgi:hypothetical protein